MKNKLESVVALFSCFGFIFSISLVSAQDVPRQLRDSIHDADDLETVYVEAFAQNRLKTDQPLALSTLASSTISKFGSHTIVSAMNTLPGVRMEQRSPGSYRLNIRGSSLRSPFGVRNVKIYYKGIPFTDPGGNTYLNQLSLRDMNSIAVLKGPSGSLYGAGMGGVMIINSELSNLSFQKNNTAELELSGGSFGTKNGSIKVGWDGDKSRSMIRYSNFQSDGYRDHTALHQQVVSYETHVKLNEMEDLEGFLHYTNLFYQTPGALTKEEFDINPRAARPAAGIFPSAKESNASVEQKAFLAGLKHTYRFSEHLENTISLYGAYTDFTNPTFRNYELRKEPHFGGRTIFKYKRESGEVKQNYLVGGELQQGYFSQRDFGNIAGKPDTIQTSDDVNELSALVFAQADIQFKQGWEASFGMSLNYHNLHFRRYVPVEDADFRFKSHPVWAPRVSISKKIGADNLLYGSVSRGFSPPTLAEILPSTAEINRDLDAEKGMQYEIGSKGSYLNNRINYDVSLFVTRLSQSISSRKDASGADYFLNAGNALQKGAEIALEAVLYDDVSTFVSMIRSWGSLTLFDFKYKHYKVNDEDFSDKRFPGSAKLNFAAGFDLSTEIGLATHLTYQKTSKIPLDDANTIYAKDYDLLGIEISYPFKIGSNLGIQLFASGNNLLNQTYSLGNDINAFGGRYYNLAPKINFNGGVRISYN